MIEHLYVQLHLVGFLLFLLSSKRRPQLFNLWCFQCNQWYHQLLTNRYLKFLLSRMQCSHPFNLTCLQ